jgi:hypothetical protein
MAQDEDSRRRTFRQTTLHEPTKAPETMLLQRVAQEIACRRTQSCQSPCLYRQLRNELFACPLVSVYVCRRLISSEYPELTFN